MIDRREVREKEDPSHDMEHTPHEPNAVTMRQNRRRSRLMLWMTLGGIGMVSAYSAIFLVLMDREGRPHSWIDAVYWTITTMSTLGYGDITFSSGAGRLFSMLVLASGILLILVLLPFLFVQFIVRPWMEQREKSRAPRSVPEHLRGHLILVGFDAVTQTLIARAKRARTPSIVLVDDPADASRLHDEGYQAMVGPLDSPATYRKAGVERAVMVVSTQVDTTNTNVAFTVRQVNKTVKIAVTADKDASVDVLQLAGANHVFQLSSSLGRELASRAVGTRGHAHVVGSIGETLIAEAAVRGTPLVGLTLDQVTHQMKCPASILAIMQRGRLRPMGPDSRIDERAVLIVAGSREDLDTFNDQFQSPEGVESPVLILGGGRVGRAVAGALDDSRVPTTIVEKIPGRTPPHLTVVEGDASDIEVLQAAGLTAASAVVITSHDDDFNVYLTLYCRRLRPDLQIVSRATSERNVATLYRAGADSVLSYATIGATALWNELGRAHRVVIAEGNELFSVPRPRSLSGAALRDEKIHDTTGCHIVAAIDSDGTLQVETEDIPTDDLTHVVLLGDRHAERAFRNKYVKGR